MFEEVVQVILRNQGDKGYETVYSSTDIEIETELLHLLLPRTKTNEINPNYYFKYPINNEYTLVKLVQDDGVDKYNRFKAKVILFIVPNKIYESVGGLLYFASPLWLHTLKNENNEPLDYRNDFENYTDIQLRFEEKFSLKFHEFLLDKLLLYENVILSFTQTKDYEKNRLYLLQSLAYIDSKLPSFFRNQISIKTFANKLNKDLANCLIINNIQEVVETDITSFVINYPSILKQDELIIKTRDLPKKMLHSRSQEDLESIGRILMNPKAARDDILSAGIYNRFSKRFGIKDTNFFNRLFKNSIFR